MRHTDEEIIQLFKAAVYEVDQKKLGEVTPTTQLAQLGLDSVATMEVIGALEEKLSVRFPDEELATLKSVGDLTALVRRVG
ncbi:acyl carrier protein [Myxococcota bacterium]|nr:acyl carrier protein [Myxococcota bacterium]